MLDPIKFTMPLHPAQIQSFLYYMAQYELCLISGVTINGKNYEVKCGRPWATFFSFTIIHDGQEVGSLMMDYQSKKTLVNMGAEKRRATVHNDFFKRYEHSEYDDVAIAAAHYIVDLSKRHFVPYLYSSPDHMKHFDSVFAMYLDTLMAMNLDLPEAVGRMAFINLYDDFVYDRDTDSFIVTFHGTKFSIYEDTNGQFCYEW